MECHIEPLMKVIRPFVKTNHKKAASLTPLKMSHKKASSLTPLINY